MSNNIFNSKFRLRVNAVEKFPACPLAALVSVCIGRLKLEIIVYTKIDRKRRIKLFVSKLRFRGNAVIKFVGYALI